MTTITIDRRYCGPPNSGNGGYVCGRLAQRILGGAEVTLHAPPPLEKPLDVVETGSRQYELRDGAVVVATARAATVQLTRREKASFQEAYSAALLAPLEPDNHPLPGCFVCGPERAQGDGLRIFAMPLERQLQNGSVPLAAAWIPDSTLAAEDGLVAPEFIWSALDCPTGYASARDARSGSFERTPILLGRMSAQIVARPRPGERCVITAWEVARDGRKRAAEAALYGEAGSLLAVARSTWIVVDR